MWQLLLQQVMKESVTNTTSTGNEGICDDYFFNRYRKESSLISFRRDILQNDSLGMVFEENTCQMLVSTEICLVMYIVYDIRLLINLS